MFENGEAKRPDLSGCTCLRLRKASRRVSQIYDHYLQRHGLTITQYGLLAHLSRLDGISIGALAGKLIMDPTTLTRNLRPLERQELIRLAADPRDRRSRRLHLTEQGRTALIEARPAWVEAQRHIEGALGPSEAPVLHAALDHMLKRLAS
jgi:DNA-binding MarR family transcriptional regulator